MRGTKRGRFLPIKRCHGYVIELLDRRYVGTTSPFPGTDAFARERESRGNCRFAIIASL